MRFLLLSLLWFSTTYAGWEKVVYPLTTDPIDVIIPCAPKDLRTLDFCIDGIKKYGANLGRILVISKNPLTNKAEWFDEAKFPFTKEMLALELFQGDRQAAQDFLDHPNTRIGWIYQQLLKLYAPFVIPDLSPNVLVLDADVIFVRPISFLGPCGEPLFASSCEQIQEYFEHAARLLPGFQQALTNRSGVAHHMLFQKSVLTDLLEQMRQYHNTEPWKGILHCISLKNIYSSSFSEYEIYFNFAFLKTDQSILRPLKWTNVSSPSLFMAYGNQTWDFVTSHSWSIVHPYNIQDHKR